ncbi:MAG: hypothetical protein RQ751_06815 [Longimicrobiales bacterium]|nr:hypothetical protein [Longimicrobiales bacterium]
MPIQDRTLRTPPYLRIFPDDRSREEVLDEIAREVEARGEGGDDPGAFTLLERTRRALAELREPGEEDDGGHTHGVLLFHAFHLRRAGAEHLLASAPVCRWAVEGAGPEGPGAAADAATGEGLPAAVYVQLPQHLFWVREAPGERPLSLDGFFWTVRGDVVHVLGVVDFQPQGGGIRVLPMPGVPLAERSTWLTGTMREGGEDFQSEIPGGEMEGLYEVRTAGELLKLAARLDRFLVRFPGAAEPLDPPEPGGGALRPRRLVLT